jgi:hypothetical protein
LNPQRGEASHFSKLSTLNSQLLKTSPPSTPAPINQYMKFILLFIAVFFNFIITQAQHFTELNVEDFPLRQDLPIFTQHHKLGMNENEDNYEVRIEFPEFTPLTHQEQKILKTLNIQLP